MIDPTALELSFVLRAVSAMVRDASNSAVRCLYQRNGSLYLSCNPVRIATVLQ